MKTEISPKKELSSKISKKLNEDEISLREQEINLLKKFDLDLKFGPCLNVKRIDRWNWASRHELNPPEIVKKILEEHPNDVEYAQSLWFQYSSLI
ncbi:unnamed protein product [Brachionus calyciflorus]|uniref:DNA polymerase delta subunit 4 n=1 Tax=Brachionus calyciflorus TaxID=104777 RepID=A0A813X7V8_9BILA|nr:unnamed protein product [Brachionus calyciflorus]